MLAERRTRTGLAQFLLRTKYHDGLSVDVDDIPLINNILCICIIPSRMTLNADVSTLFFWLPALALSDSHRKSRFSYWDVPVLNTMSRYMMYSTHSLEHCRTYLSFAWVVLSTVSLRWQGGSLQAPLYSPLLGLSFPRHQPEGWCLLRYLAIPQDLNNLSAIQRPHAALIFSIF